jgi:hypothetical protein
MGTQYLMILMRYLYLIFRDLPLCLHMIVYNPRFSLYVPAVSCLSVSGVLFSTFLFCHLF